MTKPRGKTYVFLTKPRGMNDFVKPNEQSSSLLEYSAMARNRTFKKGTLYAPKVDINELKVGAFCRTPALNPNGKVLA